MQHQQPSAPAIVLEHTEDNTVLLLSGNWLKYADCPNWRDFACEKIHPAAVVIRDAGIASWNSSLVTFLSAIIQNCRDNGIPCQWDLLPQGTVTLLKLAFAVPEKQLTVPNQPKSLLEVIGIKAVLVWESMLRMLDFTGLVCEAVIRFLCRRTRTKPRDILVQIARCGHQALPLISLIGFLIGLILAFIGCIPLRMFGAEIYVASLVGIGILRMMGPVMVGTVMAGRIGAAFAAELGSMNSNEEVDAFIAMGLSPVEILILPRFLALSITMPLLCLYADLIGVIGGIAVGIYYSGIGFVAYTHHLFATTSLRDFFVGLFTCWVFGILISMCGCYHGLHCGRNSTAVGQAATSAVVSSIVCMTIATAIITVVTVNLGI